MAKAKRKTKKTLRKRKTSKGFTHWEVLWDKTLTHFQVKTKQGRFFGTIDTKHTLVIKFDRLMQTGDVANIPYDKDPRKNQRSLDADVCAAIAEWLHNHPYPQDGVCAICGDKSHQAMAPTTLCVKYLKSQLGNKLTVRVRRLETIDSIITGLKDMRDTCLRCGGGRGFAIDSDVDASVHAWVDLNLSKYAIALNGRVPSLGVPIDKHVSEDTAPKKTKHKGKRGRRAKPKTTEGLVPQSTNVEALVEKLKNSTDAGEKRKLRMTLRKMGHKGGARK